MYKQQYFQICSISKFYCRQIDEYLNINKFNKKKAFRAAVRATFAESNFK